MRSARTAEELRAAQAVLMPLMGYSLEETAGALGRSRYWVSRARNSAMRGEPPSGRHGGRRHALVTEDEELRIVRAAILKQDWYPTRKPLRTNLRDALEARFDGPPSESTLTAILNRAARHFLGHKLARGRDLEFLSHSLASIWHAQERVDDYLDRLRR